MRLIQFISGENMMKFLVCCYLFTAVLFAARISGISPEVSCG